jgi:exopolyphosphatase/guanosine-5'-triphosphate,3'-diphosphate pyrophosphatase
MARSSGRPGPGKLPRLLQFPFVGLDHSERVLLAAAIHARYAGDSDDPALAPSIGLLSAGLRRRALILGRVLLLGYRLSGSVPEIPANARLRIAADVVQLQVGRGARGPGSEVVRDRLDLVASAIGVRHTEIVEAADCEATTASQNLAR